ncbi:MAG: hypothetical protein HFJ57_05505 [Clostridia bacterium]|nr:hypothetical protein [Clostridia bacterium]
MNIQNEISITKDSVRIAGTTYSIPEHIRRKKRLNACIVDNVLYVNGHEVTVNGGFRKNIHAFRISFFNLLGWQPL